MLISYYMDDILSILLLLLQVYPWHIIFIDYLRLLCHEYIKVKWDQNLVIKL